MYTRALFQQQCDKSVAIDRALRRLMAVMAVVLGLGQLAIIRLAAGRLAPTKQTAFELAMFVAYVSVIAFLAWQRGHQVRAARPRCPACRVVIADAAAANVLATGTCAVCRAQVIQN